MLILDLILTHCCCIHETFWRGPLGEIDPWTSPVSDLTDFPKGYSWCSISSIFLLISCSATSSKEYSFSRPSSPTRWSVFPTSDVVHSQRTWPGIRNKHGGPFVPLFHSVQPSSSSTWFPTTCILKKVRALSTFPSVWPVWIWFLFFGCLRISQIFLIRKNESSWKFLLVIIYKQGMKAANRNPTLT